MLQKKSIFVRHVSKESTINSNGATHAKELLSLVHSDVCGKIGKVEPITFSWMTKHITCGSMF